MHDYSMFGKGDRSRLPTLRDWQPRSEIDLTKIDNATRLLVAARMHGGGGPWYYEYFVLRVCKFESELSLHTDDGPWFWPWSQVDYVIQLERQPVEVASTGQKESEQ